MDFDIYRSVLDDYNTRIDNLLIQRDRLVSRFKTECSHSDDDISQQRSFCEGFVYQCDHCGEVLTVRTKLDTMQEVREALNKQIKEKY